MSSELIRRAVPSDRAQLVDLLDRAFSSRPFPESFGVHFPHFFTAAAIGQHHLAFDGSTLLGCVGAYRFTAALLGSTLQVGGVGQVGTAPEARGHGIMTRLLDAALDSEGEVDLWWLYGDARRYGRVGFAPGGAQVEIQTQERYTKGVAMEGPPIRALDLVADDQLIARTLADQNFALVLAGRERLQMLTGNQTHGWTDGAAVLLLDPSGRHGWCQRGEPEALARLVAHQTAMLHSATGESVLRLQVDPGDARTLTALRPLCQQLTITPTACLRIGRLLPLLRLWALAHPPPPGCPLRPSTLDGGAAGAVRIACEDGAWRIEAYLGHTEHRYEGAELAQLVMGGLPIAAFQLPQDGALSHLLPLQFHIPLVYAL